MFRRREVNSMKRFLKWLGDNQLLWFKRWKGDDWSSPKHYDNWYRELCFGKFSIFYGKGKNHPSHGVRLSEI